MEEFDLDTVVRKSVKGTVSLVSRTFLVYVFGLIANIILWAYLTPAQYGIFFVVQSIVIFLTYFQDIGLAGSLIQKKEEPTIAEYRVAFTVQQLLVLLIIIPAFIFSTNIVKFYHLGNAGLFLFDAFLVSFFLSSLQTIPTVILERHLNFHKLIIPQIIENVVYNTILIIMVIRGFGIQSFTIAVLARSITGLIIMYKIQPWAVGIHFDKPTFTKLFSFGLPFQLNSMLALVKDNLITIYIAKFLPLTQVGYVGFGQKLAFLPSTLVMDNVIKITFPSYSRLQHDHDALKLVLEKSLFVISLFIFPTIAAISLFSPYLMQFIPKYTKWEPASLSIVFFSMNILFASITVPLTNFLNAIGKVKTTLNIMIFLTILTWALTPFFIHLFGFNGVALASMLVAASLLIVVPVAHKYNSFSFFKSIYRQFIAMCIMVIITFFIKIMIHDIITLILVMIFSALIYLATMYILAKKELISAVQFIIKR